MGRCPRNHASLHVDSLEALTIELHGGNSAPVPTPAHHQVCLVLLEGRHMFAQFAQRDQFGALDMRGMVFALGADVDDLELRVVGIVEDHLVGLLDVGVHRIGFNLNVYQEK